MKKLIAFTALITILSVVYSWNNSNDIAVNDDDNIVARRLDDHGDNSKRSVASFKWNLYKETERSPLPISKLAPIFPAKVIAKTEKVEISAQEVLPESAFKDVRELSLPLTEAFGRDTKKFPNGISASEISGQLELKDGNIESLDVTIRGETITANYSELKGNSFSYKLEGEDCYGALIPTGDKKVFIVELTGGPLDKTRLMFGNMKKVQAAAAPSAPAAPATPAKVEAKASNTDDSQPMLHEVQDDMELRAEMQLPEENPGA